MSVTSEIKKSLAAVADADRAFKVASLLTRPEWDRYRRQSLDAYRSDLASTFAGRERLRTLTDQQIEAEILDRSRRDPAAALMHPFVARVKAAHGARTQAVQVARTQLATLRAQARRLPAPVRLLNEDPLVARLAGVEQALQRAETRERYRDIPAADKFALMKKAEQAGDLDTARTLENDLEFELERASLTPQGRGAIKDVREGLEKHQEARIAPELRAAFDQAAQDVTAVDRRATVIDSVIVNEYVTRNAMPVKEVPVTAPVRPNTPMAVA